ncbi:MAG: hypothetical protein CVT49_07405 [candidate division Zixibacteria bacterium HGW-Zixibacteria-1]|nr:MAG: hypothetical protein CVT49_07405 [candidate division Zixibacteria bacterium HGW-Zixibacteria-1]
MARKKRKHNPNLIKGRRSYTFAEIAQVFGVHVRTVQIWRKHGLKIIDETSKPYLVSGEDVRDFLRVKYSKRKQELQPGEFFCVSCRSPRRSLPQNVRIISTGRKLGSCYKQVIIKGVCSVCGRNLTVFSSDRKWLKLSKIITKLTECKIQLIGTEGHCFNTDIDGGLDEET